MDFTYSDEQRLLADSVGRFVRDAYDFEAWRKLTRSELGFNRAHWRQMAELGWLALFVPEEFDGLGGGGVEAMIVAEQFGRGLVLEPYLSTAVIAAQLIGAGGSADHRATLLPAIAGGEAIFALAHAERQAGFDIFDVATSAKPRGAGYVIDGHKIAVLDAPHADRLIVLARTGGERRDRDGLSLFLIDAKAPGVTRRDYQTLDLRRASDIRFEGVTVGADALIGEAGRGLELLAPVLDRALAFLAAEAVGAMAVLHETTAAYARTRKQFGKPIGSFQVIQHRLVDMMAEVEQARSLAMVAAMRVDGEPAMRSRTAAAAKAKTGQAGRFLGQQAIQLHGGMGMTDELSVGHYAKRLMVIDMTFGNADHHLKRFATAA